MPSFGTQCQPLLEERIRLRRLAMDFLKGKTADHTGTTLDQYYTMTEAEMESCHGWIQWAFPIDTISPYNGQCGNYFRLDTNVIRAYKFGTGLYKSRDRLIDQYLATVGVQLYSGTDITKFFQVVDSPYNHHMKRLSRIMLHLMITGNTMYARQLYKTLIYDLVLRSPNSFEQKTIAYWGSIVLGFDNIAKDRL